eukprot:14149420-Alexandrium_andersonii.AAC.1
MRPFGRKAPLRTEGPQKGTVRQCRQGGLSACSRRSNLELRGPRNDLKFGPRSSRGVDSVALLGQMPNPTRYGPPGAPEALIGG